MTRMMQAAGAPVSCQRSWYVWGWHRQVALRRLTVEQDAEVSLAQEPREAGSKRPCTSALGCTSCWRAEVLLA